MKKLVTTLLATTAAALGLFFAGSANADASTNYTVKSGDSVWAISQKFDTTINAIETANKIQNHLILPGEKLVIPDADSTTAAPAQPATTATATQQPAATTQQSTQTYSQPAASTQTQTTSSAANYNGGSTKSYVLSQMESRTGVSASTWNYIIQRESNWQPSVRNSSSGAYGLFQNMHISGGSVQDQVNAAVSLYHSQGMGAWSM